MMRVVRSVRRFGLLAALMLTPVFVSHDAFAQASGDRVKAAWKLEEGKRALAKGDADKAVPILEEAHAVIALPTSGLPLAQALAKTGKLVRAREVATATAKHPKSAKEAFTVTQARANADKLRIDLDKRIPKLTVSVSGATSHTLRVDGADAPPLEDGVLRIDPGAHRVEAVAGGKTVGEEVKLTEGEARTLSLALGGAAAAPAKPDAPAKAPPDDDDAPAKEPAKPLVERTPHVHAEQGHAAAVVSILGFGLGFAGIGIGVGGFLVSGSNKDELEALGCTSDACPDRLARRLDEADTIGLVSIVGFAVGGAGIVTGIVGLAVEASSGPDEPGDVALELGPGFVGVRGAF
jgi:hypothetical protein